MSNKKCENCGFITEDSTMELCPLCNTELLDDTPKTADKKIKIITASVAFVLVLALGFFGWYVFSGKTGLYSNSISVGKIAGDYMSHDDVEYFNFSAKEVKVDVPTATDSNYEEQSTSDGLSDGSIKTQAKTETKVFDGTYETGFTEKYVQDLLIVQYINKNELFEAYSKYVEENDLFADDFAGFAKEKNIPQAELDKIDKETGLSNQREYYVTKGYWKCNKETGMVDLYDEMGSQLISSFVLTGDAIVESESFLRGKNSDKEKFETSYECNASEYSETLSFYKDGKCILATSYSGEEETYTAGTYKNSKGYVQVKLGEEKRSYVKVKDGIAIVAYIKQK